MPRQRKDTPAEGVPDAGWFKIKLIEKGESARRMCRELGMDHTRFSKIIHGTLTADVGEVRDLATYFKVPADEIVSHLGHHPSSLTPGGLIRVHALADASGSARKVRSSRAVLPPADAPTGSAVMLDMPGSPMHGWVLLYNDDAPRPAESSGKLVVASRTIAGTSDIVGTIAPGSRSGTWDVTPLGATQPTFKSVKLYSASPVVWIRT